MKICPWCAEQNQDAAIVCKHCGRDLPRSSESATPPTVAPAKKPIGAWPVIGIVVAATIGLAMLGPIMQRIASSKAKRPGECTLHARATVVTRDAPFARAIGWNTNILAIRNMDGAEWDNLDVTINGFVTTGTSGRQQTGPYKLKKGAGSFQNGLIALDLRAFEKPSGEQWSPMTMSVDAIDLKASLRGEACSVEISPDSSVSDVIGR